MVKQVKPLEQKEVTKEIAEYKPIVEHKSIQKNDNNKTVIPVVLKIKLYKYVLIAMSFLLGFHLYNVVQFESTYLFAITENPEMIEMINTYYEMQRKALNMTHIRKALNMTHIVTVLFCILLIVVAGVLYKIELALYQKKELKR